MNTFMGDPAEYTVKIMEAARNGEKTSITVERHPFAAGRKHPRANA